MTLFDFVTATQPMLDARDYLISKLEEEGSPLAAFLVSHYEDEDEPGEVIDLLGSTRVYPDDDLFWILTLAGLCEDHADERIRALAPYFNACVGR